MYLYVVKYSLFVVFFLLHTLVISQGVTVDKEWFSLSSGTVYSIEDEYFGLNGRLAFPLQRGFNLSLQATYFPVLFNGKYEEFRGLGSIEIIPYRFNHFFLYFQAGLDRGIYRRLGGFEYLEPSKYILDMSAMFGIGLEFDFEDFSILIDHKYYPEIWSNHLSVGFKILFFETHQVRKSYRNYRFKKQRYRKGDRLRKRNKNVL